MVAASSISALLKYEGNPLAKRRVVITGLGLITPVGLSVKESWGNILEGKSGIAPLDADRKSVV